MARVTYYQSTDVDCILAGLSLKDGRAETFIEIEAAGPAFETEMGADGHVVRYATNEKRYNVRLNFKGTSEELQKLAALHAADVAAGNGSGVGALLIKDNNGASLFAASEAWITTAIPKTFGNRPEDVTVELLAIAEPVTMVAGGN